MKLSDSNQPKIIITFLVVLYFNFAVTDTIGHISRIGSKFILTIEEKIMSVTATLAAVAIYESYGSCRSPYLSPNDRPSVLEARKVSS